MWFKKNIINEWNKNNEWVGSSEIKFSLIHSICTYYTAYDIRTNKNVTPPLPGPSPFSLQVNVYFQLSEC